jgi:hypothetical protein
MSDNRRLARWRLFLVWLGIFGSGGAFWIALALWLLP